MIFSEETYGFFRAFICPFSMKLCRCISYPLKMGVSNPKQKTTQKSNTYENALGGAIMVYTHVPCSVRVHAARHTN